MEYEKLRLFIYLGFVLCSVPSACFSYHTDFPQRSNNFLGSSPNRAGGKRTEIFSAQGMRPAYGGAESAG
jgi:hypothetical protein